MNNYRSPLAPGLAQETPSRTFTSGAWDDALTAAVAHHAARICEEQASRFEDDRGRYVANECAAAIRANSTALGEMTQVPVRTFGRMLDRIATLELDLRKQERITAHADELLQEAIRGEARLPQEVERLRKGMSTPSAALHVLADVVRCLRETGEYRDEEGEATDRLQEVLDALRNSDALSKSA